MGYGEEKTQPHKNIRLQKTICQAYSCDVWSMKESLFS